MAINTASPAPQSPQPPSHTQPIDIEAWTEQATAAMGSVTISPAPVQGTTVTIDIPLDDHPAPPAAPANATAAANASPLKRKEPKQLLRRDSLKRREALLRGKEGSRRRQRWENGKLAPYIHLITYPAALRGIPYYCCPQNREY